MNKLHTDTNEPSKTTSTAVLINTLTTELYELEQACSARDHGLEGRTPHQPADSAPALCKVMESASNQQQPWLFSPHPLN